MIDEQLEELAHDLYRFMKKRFKFDRDPHIKFEFDEANAENILGKTGYYDPDTEEIVIYAYGRHPKDVLRSLAHELIHHVQKCDGHLTHENSASESDPNYIVHDKFLEGIEADAFERGNIAFRFWEAGKKMNDKENALLDQEENLDERKKKKKKHTKKQIDKVHRMAGKMEKEKGYPTEKAFKIAWSRLGESTGEQMSEENKNKQPEVNEALKDSVVYNPQDRSCNDLYNNREETVFQDLLKKFGIKKQNG